MAFARLLLVDELLLRDVVVELVFLAPLVDEDRIRVEVTEVVEAWLVVVLTALTVEL